MTDADERRQTVSVDPSFLHRFRAAYAGRHAVADALWWVEHPNTVAPSGSLPPASGLAELERAVFSAPADEDTLNNAIVLAQLKDDLAKDRHFTEQALQAARTATDEQADRPEQADPIDEPPAGETWPLRQSAPHLRTRTVVLKLAATTVIAGTAGALIAAALVGPTREESSFAATPATVVSGLGATPSFSALNLLRSSNDHPDVPLGAGIIDDTVREIARATILNGDTGEVTQPLNRVFASRDVGGNVCLSLVSASGMVVTSRVPEDQFPVSGLTLSWISTEYSLIAMSPIDRELELPVADEIPVEMTATWTSSDGGNRRYLPLPPEADN